jgi:FeS assembly SUF system protein
MENKRQPLPLDHEGGSKSLEANETALSSGEAADSSDSGQTLEEKVLAALRTCYDPEIPVNIFELGLIYEMNVDSEGAVSIKMTLTSPACPVAGTLPGEVQSKVQGIPGVKSVKVELVWDPPWDKSRMSEAAMLELGLF